MAKFKKEVSVGEIVLEHYTFTCPGCNEIHAVYTKVREGSKHAVWSFNNDIDKPTVSPSLKIWHNGRPKYNIPPYCCHSFIKEGKIQFLGDCTHELKGQTVELPEVKE